MDNKLLTKVLALLILMNGKTAVSRLTCEILRDEYRWAIISTELHYNSKASLHFRYPTFFLKLIDTART